jgi:hypothetical protein
VPHIPILHLAAESRMADDRQSTAKGSPSRARGQGLARGAALKCFLGARVYSQYAYTSGATVRVAIYNEASSLINLRKK